MCSVPSLIRTSWICEIEGHLWSVESWNAPTLRTGTIDVGWIALGDIRLVAALFVHVQGQLKSHNVSQLMIRTKSCDGIFQLRNLFVSR